jgi:hypothetical protein
MRELAMAVVYLVLAAFVSALPIALVRGGKATDQ